MMRLIAKGKKDKVIARKLGVSNVTVWKYRQRPAAVATASALCAKTLTAQKVKSGTHHKGHLSRRAVRHLKKMLKEGRPVARVAKALGVSLVTVYNYRKSIAPKKAVASKSTVEIISLGKAPVMRPHKRVYHKRSHGEGMLRNMPEMVDASVAENARKVRLEKVAGAVEKVDHEVGELVDTLIEASSISRSMKGRAVTPEFLRCNRCFSRLIMEQSRRTGLCEGCRNEKAAKSMH